MANNNKKTIRIIELDTLRGSLLVLMLLQHFCIILLNSQIVFFNFPDVTYDIVNLSMTILDSYAVRLIKHLVMWLFVFLAGITINFGSKKYKRTLKCTIVALIITLLTFLIELSGYPAMVWFGIFHFYAVCSIMWLLLDKINNKHIKFTIILGIFTLCLLDLIFKPTLDNNYLMWFGIPSIDYVAAFDYFPLSLYIVPFSLGVFYGRVVYKENLPLIRMRSNPFSFIGKRSVIVYIIQFPIIIGIVWLYLFLGGNYG